MLIKRFITDEEMVWLMQHTKAVVPRHPGRAGLLRAVRRGQVDDVFVTRLSQLSRKAGRLRCILRLLHRKRVRLHTTESDLRYDLYRHGLDSILI